jgi:hypothetical protein
MELAGEIADGLHTACAYAPEALGYAVKHFRAGVERAGRSPDGLDLGDSLLGAIAPNGEVARRAGRILAAFYLPSMPPALLERHGVEPDRVTPVNEAFAAGDVQGALEATPEEVADRIMVAGTPEDWVRWLTETLCPPGPQPRLGVVHRSVHPEGLGRGGGRGSTRFGSTGSNRRRAGHPRARAALNGGPLVLRSSGLEPRLPASLGIPTGTRVARHRGGGLGVDSRFSSVPTVL